MEKYSRRGACRCPQKAVPLEYLNVEQPPLAVDCIFYALRTVAEAETPARLLYNRGHLNGGLYHFLKTVEIMNEKEKREPQAADVERGYRMAFPGVIRTADENENNGSRWPEMLKEAGREAERLEEVAEAANQYNLAGLLERLCLHDTPDNVRRSLSDAYFMLSRELGSPRHQLPVEQADPLETLGDIVQALDTMTPAADDVDNLPLVVKPWGSDDPTATASTLRQYADAAGMAEYRAHTALDQAGLNADLNEYLYSHFADRLTDEEREAYEVLKQKLHRQNKAKADEYKKRYLQ